MKFTLKRKFWLFLLFQHFMFSLAVCSQEVVSPEIGNMLLEILGEEDENTDEAEEIFENLTEIYLKKENINQVSPEVLEKIPFLTEFQVFSFLEYRKKYGTIYSSNELYLITGFHEGLIRKIKFLFDFEPYPVSKDTIGFHRHRLHHKLLIRTKFEYPLRTGFTDNSDSSLHFNGVPAYRLLKYELERTDKFRIGLTMESDPGESITFDSTCKGFNFNSFYGEFYRKGIIKHLIVGDFKIEAAEGLIYSGGRGGKTSANAFQRKAPVLKKYSSTGEFGYYRGFGFQAGQRGIRLMGFYSAVRHSGNVYLNPDSTTYFRSFHTSGLFRNRKELEKQNNIKENAAGISLFYLNDNFQAGYNFKLSGFNPKIEYQKKGDPYSGTGQADFLYWQSLFYGFQFNSVVLSGELAYKKGGGSALMQKISLLVHPLFTLNFAYRNINPEYFCPGSTSFSEKGNSRNEQGLYVGFIAYPFSFLKIRVYIDQFRFPWIDYRSSFPTRGTDFYFDSDWYFSDRLDLRIYFKLKNKLINTTKNDSPVTQMIKSSSCRFYGQFSWKISNTFSSRSRIEIKFFTSHNESKSGTLIYQEFTRSFPKLSAKLNLRYSIFDIPDWQVRIYVWEHDLLYAFSSPSFYQTGFHFFLNFRYKACKNINLGLKLSTTGYTSPREAGSSVDFRSGNNFYEAKAQCILKI